MNINNIRKYLAYAFIALIAAACVVQLYREFINIKPPRMGTLIYAIHYPEGVRYMTIKCHYYRIEAGRGTMRVRYCTNADKHLICDAEGFATTAPIEIVSFTY